MFYIFIVKAFSVELFYQFFGNENFFFNWAVSSLVIGVRISAFFVLVQVILSMFLFRFRSVS